MTYREGLQELLDFIYDRGRFGSGAELKGMAVSQKPLLFVDFYLGLPQIDRGTMNECLISALLGKVAQTEGFIGIVAMLLVTLVERVDGTGLEAFQSDLMAVLQVPEKRCAWLDQLEQSPDFREDWRYPLAILSILAKLRIPGVREIAMEMAANARSQQFRVRLSEIATNA